MSGIDGEILHLAMAVSGAAEADEGLMELLCTAARQYWESRMRQDVLPETCGAAFRCAAAFTAAADFQTGCGGEGVESFTAGEISVKGRTAAESAAQAQGLRDAARRLMAPYVTPEDFFFKGVRG